MSAPVRPENARWSPVKAMPSSSAEEPSRVGGGLKSRVMLPSECPGVCSTFYPDNRADKNKGQVKRKISRTTTSLTRMGEGYF